MIIKYNIEIQNESIIINIDRIINQIFKLLPSREEGEDWQTPLINLFYEIKGMDSLFQNEVSLFALLCKMESLLILKEKDDFPQFRKTIFECLGILSEVKKCLQNQ